MDSSKEQKSFKDEAHRMSGEIVGVCEGYEGYSVEEEKAVLRKIDMVILPFVSIQLLLPGFSSANVT
jgi:hypothetical protein